MELEFHFLPTLSGEAVAIRFSAVNTEAPTLETLGASAAVRRLLEELTEGRYEPHPGGLVVVAGGEPAPGRPCCTPWPGWAPRPGGA